jgi:8-oxo-dGTP pyrophosphatase MutT (NUDIX family)
VSHEIRRVEERKIYANKFFTLYDDDVRFPDGSNGRYTRLAATEPGSGVVLAPIYDGKIGIVRVFRYALDALVWELPRGFSHGESIENTALNELREELGVKEAKTEILGFMHPDSGVQTARVAVVAAWIADAGSGSEDTVEVESTMWVEPREFERMIRCGEIEDGFSLAAYALLKLRET